MYVYSYPYICFQVDATGGAPIQGFRMQYTTEETANFDAALATWCTTKDGIYYINAMYCISEETANFVLCVMRNPICRHPIHVTWLVPMWRDVFLRDITHFCVTWLIYVTWFISVWHDPFLCGITYVAWLIHIWHDPFICDMTHSYVTWLIHILHDPFIPL